MFFYNKFFYNKFFYKKKLTSLILTALTMILLWGCSREQSNIVVRMAYQGEVEEAPLIIAYEKGFFKKEGVDVELVRQDFEGIKAAIDNGGIHGATFDYRAFEAVDSGSNIKLVAGLHSGCTQIIVKENSGINSLNDLKNKIIGITNIGNGSMAVTADLLRELKIDQSIKWVEGNEESLRKLLQKNGIDAISILEHPDPSKRTLSSGEKVLFSSSIKNEKGKSYKHFYESFIGFEGNFIDENRKVAFNASIAWLKAAQWVNENQNEAYSILIDKGYVNDNYESIADKTAFFMWMPGVKYARDHIEIYADVQRSQNILKSGMSQKEFLKKVFEPLIPELNGR